MATATVLHLRIPAGPEVNFQILLMHVMARHETCLQFEQKIVIMHHKELNVFQFTLLKIIYFY